MQQEDGLLGEVCDIAALLLEDVEMSIYAVSMASNLYESFSPVVVVVKLVSEVLKDC